MSLLFWRKTQDEGTQTPSVAVTETTPLPVQLIHLDDNDVPPVRVEQAYLPPVSGVSITRRVQVPGISTGIYAAGDAFGTLITLPEVFRANVNSGAVTRVVVLDLDDEGSQVDLMFYNKAITTTADNAAYAPSDEDILSSEGGLSVTTFFNLANNQIGGWDGSHWVESTDTNLYVRLVTQGTPTIAAGAAPWLLVTIVPD